jgi:hypothetical protein
LLPRDGRKLLHNFSTSKTQPLMPTMPAKPVRIAQANVNGHQAALRKTAEVICSAGKFFARKSSSSSKSSFRLRKIPGAMSSG